MSPHHPLQLTLVPLFSPCLIIPFQPKPEASLLQLFSQLLTAFFSLEPVIMSDFRNRWVDVSVKPQHIVQTTKLSQRSEARALLGQELCSSCCRQVDVILKLMLSRSPASPSSSPPVVGSLGRYI